MGIPFIANPQNPKFPFSGGFDRERQNENSNRRERKKLQIISLK
jgi:hypothetical protein